LPASAGEFGFKSFTEIISLQKRRNAMQLVWCLRNNYTFAAMDFGRRLGASDEHIPQWICKERATKPPPKRHAALRVAPKLAWGKARGGSISRSGSVTDEQRSHRPNSAQPSGRQFLFDQTSLLAPHIPLKGMLVAPASSGRKIPRRERHRSYAHDHLECACASMIKA